MKKYDIYWANLPGEGTDTTVIYGTRPVIIVSNDANNEYAPFVTVVPLTSNLFKKAMPTHVYITGQGLKTGGLALCEQIITLDKNQLSAQIGFLTKEWDKLAVEHAVQVQLGMVEAFFCTWTKGEINPMSRSNQVEGRLIVCPRCGSNLASGTLALIRQQQERIAELEAGQTARVMTLEELENALDTVVWVEEPEFENFADHYALIVAYSHKVGFARVSFGFAEMPVDCEYEYEDYGKKWRCWTQRPTDEQRKAVKWE